jgi:hypothetical protein
MKTWENTFNSRDIFWNKVCRQKFCFISTPENFEDNKVRGLKWLKKQQLKDDVSYCCDGNYIYENLDEFKKFKNSKILVVAGGPTASERDWDIDEYDYVFSCNHFYKFEKLKNKKVDLFFVGNEVNTNDQDFLDYCNKYQSLIGVEDLEYRPDHVKNLVKNFPDKTFLCLSRFQGKIGVAPKLIILAVCLGAKQVDFVGVDGTPPNYKQGKIALHSFEKNKIFACNYSDDLLLSHYKILKDFLYNDIGKNVIFNNLGKNHEYNNFSKV